MTFFKAAACAGTILAMAGCVTDQGPAAPVANFDGAYRLVTIDGKPIPGTATLTIAGQAIHGEGPCNIYNSQNNASWPQMSLAGIASTRRACIVEGGEGAYFAALGQVTQAVRTGDTLDLTGPTHKMRFTAE